MKSYNHDNDLQDLLEQEGHDREISLSTATILGIFFALALLCAVFFGFGYSMGRRSAQNLASAPETTTETASASETSGSKPSPGSPANRPAPASPANDDSASTTDSSDATPPPAHTTHAANSAPVVVVAKPAPTPTQTASAAQTPPAPAVRQVSLGRPAATPAATTPAPVAVPGVGAVMVQVAAVSHQEDANMLVSALQKRGYTVAIRQEPQDKLLHVQIGPFATKKDADAMKQRLLTDGYNAIVK